MKEDRIAIRVELAEQKVEAVHIESRQNLQACRVFLGKSAAQVLELIPLIYHVCGHAHRLAARQALAQAEQGQRSLDGIDLLPLLLETCSEHGRRVLLDWPTLRDQSADMRAMLRIQDKLNGITALIPANNKDALRQAVQELQLIINQAIYGQIMSDFREWQDLTALQSWCDASTHPAAGLLRYLQRRDLTQVGRSDVQAISLADTNDQFIEHQLAQDDNGDYVRHPHRHDRVFETGPLARMKQRPLLQQSLDAFGNGLFTRLLATLVESLYLPQQMLQLLDGGGVEGLVRQGESPRPDVGTAAVEAARGCLWHRVELAQGVVQRYQILAPTEWNFHPQGALVKGLLGMPVQNTAALLKRVNLLATALDPCVAIDVSVNDHA